jgi:hypothetical protein
MEKQKGLLCLVMRGITARGSERQISGDGGKGVIIYAASMAVGRDDMHFLGLLLFLYNIAPARYIRSRYTKPFGTSTVFLNAFWIFPEPNLRAE